MSSEQTDRFYQSLGMIGRNAFDQLCALGCERSKLAGLFDWLVTYDVPLTPTVSINPKALDRRESAHPGFELEDLRRVAKRAERLRKDLVRLRRTALVGELVDNKTIPAGDLLAGGPLHLLDGSEPFWGLLHLPKLAEQCGERQKPDETRIRKEIHTYIYKQTGTWNDGLFVAIYNDLFPTAQQSDKNIQSWRTRHGLRSDPQSKP